MSEEILKVKSIAELHQLLELPKSTHPLISIIDVSKLEIKEEWIGQKLTSDLYTIGLKDKSCGLSYGRNHYDFAEGVLIFTAPNQVMSVDKAQAFNEMQGWMIQFHPDLIRNTTLGSSIDDYTFFSYDVHEALHLSDIEQKILTECVSMMQHEISERIDNHSQRVIISSIELLLNYSLRYYERQFNTRTSHNKDIVAQVEGLMKAYYKAGNFTKLGVPSVTYFADQIALSGNYLSDLLKKETGYSAKDHINNFIVDKAKTLLLSSSDTISGVAYTLGFNYPHYSSRLFKSKTGLTPQKYRQIN